MILDIENLLSDSQLLNTVATVDSTNVIDLGIARSIGNGEPMAALFTVIVAADQGAGDEDYTFDLVYATNAALSTGVQLMGRRVFESGTPGAPAQDADLLVAGFKFSIPIPPTTGDEDGQFLGVQYVLAGTTPIITMTCDILPLSHIAQTVDYNRNYAIL